MTQENHQIGAGEFKTHCLKLIDRVSQTKQPIIITKHGKPIAKLTPLLILNAIENGEIELFDGVVENICLEVLKSLQKQQFFPRIVVGLTHRSESDEEFLNWIQKVNSLEILEQVKQELSAMYAAQKLIEF